LRPLEAAIASDDLGELLPDLQCQDGERQDREHDRQVGRLEVPVLGWEEENGVLEELEGSCQLAPDDGQGGQRVSVEDVIEREPLGPFERARPPLVDVRACIAQASLLLLLFFVVLVFAVVRQYTAEYDRGGREEAEGADPHEDEQRYYCPCVVDQLFHLFI